jgi:hypothetical protein
MRVDDTGSGETMKVSTEARSEKPRPSTEFPEGSEGFQPVVRQIAGILHS